MKILTLLTLAAIALPSQATTNVSVSIGINAPGQYGRVDVSNYPQPVLVMPQPVVYAPAPYAVYQRPIYLYVPQGQRADWGRHCGRYAACGQPVYFVQERWVHDEYRREANKRQHRKPPKDHDKDHDKDHGKGHGKGNGKH